MKKKDGRALQEKLTAAVKEILTANNAVLTDKIEKAVKNSVKQIVKKTKKKTIVKKKPQVSKK